MVVAHFLVVIPDRPNVLNRRMQVRPRHLERAETAHQQGLLIAGGALMSPAMSLMLKNNHNPSDQAQMQGSMFILDLPSEEECREWIEQDPYTQGQVWDTTKAHLYRIKLAKH
jgi:uncharacterized protein YciI